MGFARFLQNKPLNLSGIKQFTPDLTQAEKTLESITSGYDEVQALSNAIPEYLQGDSERMRAKQDEYRAGIQNTADAFANQGAQAGNALLRNMKSLIQSDFSTTGEVYGMGNNFKQRKLMEERLIANKVPSKFAKAYLDKNVPTESFDADGNFQRYEAGVAPTVPNYSEIAINAAKQIIPEKSDIDHIEYAADGVTPIAIITKKNTRIKASDIKEYLTNTMDGVPEVFNSINEFGNPAIERIESAIEGAMGIFSQNDITKKINLATGTKGGKKNKGPVEVPSPSSNGVNFIGTRTGKDLALATSAELNNVTNGFFNDKGQWVPPVKSKEILDYQNKTEDAVKVYKNLEGDALSTQNVETDLYKVAGNNLAMITTVDNFKNTWDDSDPTASIDKSFSETFTQKESDSIQDANGVVSTTPNTNTSYYEAIQDFAIGTLMQNSAGEIEDNFLELTSAEIESIKNKEDFQRVYEEKTKGYTEAQIQGLLNKLDEEDLGEKFNRSLDAFDTVIDRRNGILNKKEVIDQEVDQAFRGSLIEEDIKLLDGKNLTNDEWAQVAKNYGKEDALTNIFGVAQDKAGIGLKIEELNERADKSKEVILKYEESIKNLGASSNSKLQQTLDSENDTLEEIKKLIEQQEKLLKNSPKTSNKLEKFKEKHLEYLENFDKSKYIAEAVKNNYKSNFDYRVFTHLKSKGDIPNLQNFPATNAKLDTLAKVEAFHATPLGAKDTGTASKPTWNSSANFDMGALYAMDSGIAISETQIKKDGIIGVEYGGTIRSANGDYEQVGRLQYLENPNNPNSKLLLGKQVRIKNEQYNKDYRALLYEGNPLTIKKEIDPLWDKLKLTNQSYVDDTAILGNGYTLRLKKASNGRVEAAVIDIISGKMIQNGKKGLQNLKDSYDLADRLGGLIGGQQVTSWDKELKWDKLMSFEDGFTEGNFKFGKDTNGNELVERRALDEEFATTFMNGFKNFKSDIIINSMVRSLTNQKDLMKSEYNNNSPKQLTSGHLIGEGVDIHNDPVFMKEFEEELKKENIT
jgi:hypothetical protein